MQFLSKSVAYAIVMQIHYNIYIDPKFSAFV